MRRSLGAAFRCPLPAHCAGRCAMSSCPREVVWPSSNDKARKLLVEKWRKGLEPEVITTAQPSVLVTRPSILARQRRATWSCCIWPGVQLILYSEAICACETVKRSLEVMDLHAWHQMWSHTAQSSVCGGGSRFCGLLVLLQRRVGLQWVAKQRGVRTATYPGGASLLVVRPCCSSMGCSSTVSCPLRSPAVR